MTSQDHTTIRDEGLIPVEGGNVWYKIHGADKTTTPILCLHGGPGFPSYYLEPLKALATERPVILYDQLGCGRSDRPDDDSLWTLDRFVQELHEVKNALQLDRFHLFGHSWGSMIVAEYLSGTTEGISTVTFAGPVLSVETYLATVNKLKQGLPEATRDTLVAHESDRSFFATDYQEAYEAFMKAHWCRISPFPDEIQRSFQEFNSEIFQTMWGQVEFFCTGNLVGFDRTDILVDLHMPVLYTCGRYDITTPENVATYACMTEDSTVAIFEKSGHMTMNEEPEQYISTLSKFLNNQEFSD